MGLGKTLQVLTLLASRPLDGCPNLVVCPASVVPVWREEMAKFFPQLECDVLKTGHDFTTAAGSGRLAGELHAAAQAPSSARRSRVWLRRPGRGPVHQEPRRQGHADLLRHPGAAPARAHRHAAGEPPARPVEHLPLPAARPARLARSVRGGARRRPARARSRACASSSRRSSCAARRRRWRRSCRPRSRWTCICPLTDVQRAEYARICTEGLVRLGDDVGTAMRESRSASSPCSRACGRPAATPTCCRGSRRPSRSAARSTCSWRNSPRSSAAGTRS